MIPKAFRLVLSSKTPFIGRKDSSRFFTLITSTTSITSHTSPPTPQWAIRVSKQIDNRAVVRNRLRRQISQWLYRERAKLKPQQMLIILRRKPEETELPDLFNELKQYVQAV